MSGLLFLFEVAAFVYVAYWVFSNDAPGSRAAAKGLFRMIDPSLSDPSAQIKGAPRWSGRGPDGEVAADSKPFVGGKTPRWKT